MADVATQVPEQNQNTPVEQAQPAPPDINQDLASQLWGTAPINPAPPAGEPSSGSAAAPENTPPPPAEDVTTIELDEYFKREFGFDAATAKAEWENLRKLKDTPPAVPTPQEIQWANEDSKRFFDLLKEGKEDDVYAFLNQKKQLERLEKYDVNDVNQATEIIKANLQFKYQDLKPQDIDRLFKRQYSMPPQPVRDLDQTDEDYNQVLDEWKRQVQEREQDLMIDAKVAKPELIKYKSQIVLPDIPKVEPQSQVPDQKELEAKQEAFFNNFKQRLESSYQNFKGFSVTAKDGDVQLPISYTISPEEVASSKEEVMQVITNTNEFFDGRWFDENGNPNITQIQEDLYLLKNRDKVFQKIANESAAQRFAHHQKIQNNINLNGVNNNFAPPQPDGKTDQQRLAEQVWSF